MVDVVGMERANCDLLVRSVGGVLKHRPCDIFGDVQMIRSDDSVDFRGWGCVPS